MHFRKMLPLFSNEGYLIRDCYPDGEVNIIYASEWERHCNNERKFLLFIDKVKDINLLEKIIFEACTNIYYFFHKNLPLVLISNESKQQYTHQIQELFFNLGYSNFYEISVGKNVDCHIVLRNSPSDGFRSLRITDASKLDLYKTEFLIYHKFTNDIDQLFTDIDEELFAYIKKIIGHSTDMEMKLAWSSTEASHYKTFLKLIKSDKSLIIFNKVEYLIKKNYFCKKAFKFIYKILRNNP